MIKETKIDTLVTPWAKAMVASLLAVWKAIITPNSDKENKVEDTDCSRVVTTVEHKTVDAFSSKVIWAMTRMAFAGNRLNAMMQALWPEDGSLPVGLTVQNAYTKIGGDRKKVAVVVRNNTAYPQTLKKKKTVAWAVVASLIPEPQVLPVMAEALDGAHGMKKPN